MNEKAISWIGIGIMVTGLVLALGFWSSEQTNIMRRPFMSTEHKNRLGEEKSPYLLQHEHNPVHWFAWGEEAFQAARDEDKPIFLSIGYSTCHWCHVMEKDSFERHDVAAVMNKYFINIKVDREERPDVDQIYMDAVMSMTGRGGWPMSVFLTPDLKPFYGGTFFWRPQFIQLMEKINDLWINDRDKLVSSGDQIMGHLQEAVKPAQSVELDEDPFRMALVQFQQSFDKHWGGFGGAPKFPRSMGASLLLRIHRRTQDPTPLRMATVTLDRMAQGGMYDHLGGGFSRYSTDEKWLVPHFEKMLYDNALLAVTYLEAYQVTKNPMYAAVARETLDYTLRDMTHSDGGFYSAEDADSGGEEGKFYVWTEQELKSHLDAKEFETFQKVYNITDHGNFEHHTNILHLATTSDWSVKNSPLIQSAHKKLFAIREKRIHPHKDDKILTSWNGLMIAAMAKGYQVLGEDRYLQAAQKAAHFIKRELYQEDELLRRYRDGQSRFVAYVDDYAFLIYGLTELYHSDFEAQWISWAQELQKKQEELFWDPKQWGYFFSQAGAKDLIVRKKDTNDGALPSGNAVSALNLFRLFSLTFEKRYLERGEQTLAVLAPMIKRYPTGVSQAMVALDFHLDRTKEVAIVGSKEDSATQDMLGFLRQTFLPNVVIGLGEGLPLLKGRTQIGDQTTFYVCEGNICKKPTNDLKEAKESIDDFEGYKL